MSDVRPFQTSFNQVVSDMSRDRLDPRAGHLYNLVDYIPNELGAPLTKRGGWVYASPALTGVHTGADRVQAVMRAAFTGGTQVIAVSRDDGGLTSRLSTIASSSSATDQGTTRNVRENLTLYRGSAYILNGTGAAIPDVWNGTSLASLSGSPPLASRSCAYKDHLVLAASDDEPQRVWFAEAGDPTSWDTSFGFINTNEKVTALYSLKNSILVFHEGFLEKIIGSIPPPNTDMSLQPVKPTGTPWAESLAGTDDFVCFANANGVFYTEGNEIVDLTEKGGFSTRWRSQFDTSGRFVTGGFFKDYYIVSVSDSLPVSWQATYACHIPTLRWITLGNTAGNSFFRSVENYEEFYMGHVDEARVSTLSSLWDPSASVKNDGDGTPVTPSVELPFGPPSIGLQTIRAVYVRYDLRDEASDEPTLALSYVTDPTSSSYTAVVGADGNAYPLPETIEVKRVVRNIRKSGYGVGLKLAQTNASAQTRIYQFDILGERRDPVAV